MDIAKTPSTVRTPHGWGADPLSLFVEDAHRNSYATFVREKQLYQKLAGIDRVFARASLAMIDPSDFYSAAFLVRCYSSFRGAARLALSTEVTEAYPVIRTCLEHALFAHYLESDAEARSAWERRSESPRERESARRKLTNGKALKALNSRDAALGERAERLYETAIDFGGHPTDTALFAAMSREDRPNGDVAFNNLMLTTDPLDVRVCMKTVARVGLVALFIFEYLFPQRFDILGLRAELSALAIGL